jgi:hypothetical protein
VLPQQNAMHGLFKGTDQTGSVRLEVP